MPKATSKSRSRARRGPGTNKAEPKDRKASHLYTDDNPTTTIHGTGFKDKAAAVRTLELIGRRSLTYQFQTVNTMYNRAKHHPSMKRNADGSAGSAGMRAAMDVFRTWLDVTYPTQRETLRAGAFKPLLSKESVQRYLGQIEDSVVVSDDAKAFARMYAVLPKGKRLGNVLVDDSKPTEPDWERTRYEALDNIVPAGKEGGDGAWKLNELWTNNRELTQQHLSLIAWAWSPVKKAKLL